MDSKRIWTPTSDATNEGQAPFDAIIKDAAYNEIEGHILVLVAMPDNSSRAISLHKSEFTFHGKSADSLPASEVNKEMEKTAALFRKAKGRRWRSFPCSSKGKIQ